MSENSNSSSGGLGFAGALAIVFITLKLVGVIAWPWIWVLAPLWMGFAIVLGIAGLVAGGVGVLASAGHIGAYFQRRKRMKALMGGDA